MLQPGTYMGGITVSGSNSVTLQPGTYYLTGGGLTVSGSAQVTGTGVLLYFTGLTGGNPTSVNLSGNAVVTLTPPTSGPYQGIVLFQDRTSSASITISGNAALNTTGTEYAPGAKVTLSGNEDTDNPSHTSLGSQWIVADLSLGGNAAFLITADADNRSQDPKAAVQQALALWSAAGLDADTLRALGRTTVTTCATGGRFVRAVPPTRR